MYDISKHFYYVIIIIYKQPNLEVEINKVK